ncbi:MAG: NAD(P)H-binding protein [Bacillota bacterium]|nr:NAD(P)H-binding protein [Bacillota bacterium]
MNICLLGATGRVGSIILENAIDNNHTVHALIRDKDKIFSTKHPRLHYFEGNALNPEDISRAMHGTDVVISALNTDGSTTLSESIVYITQQMKMEKIKRIITIGTAGILQARSEPSLYRFQSSESKRKTTKDAEEHLKAYIHLKESGLDWTMVCPTYLPLGERMGVYRFEKEFLPENPSSISVFDTADFAFQQLFSNQFLKSRVGLTY